MYRCVYIYMYIYVHIYIHIYISMQWCIHTFMSRSEIPLAALWHMSVSLTMLTYTHTQTHTHLHTRIHRIHTHTHTHAHALWHIRFSIIHICIYMYNSPKNSVGCALAYGSLLTQSYVWHISVICVTRPIHMCVSWRIHTCGRTHLYVSSFTHPYKWHDSLISLSAFICLVSPIINHWLIVNESLHPFTRVTRLTHMRIHMCHMTHLKRPFANLFASLASLVRIHMRVFCVFIVMWHTWIRKKTICESFCESCKSFAYSSVWESCESCAYSYASLLRVHIHATHMNTPKDHMRVFLRILRIFWVFICLWVLRVFCVFICLRVLRVLCVFICESFAYS